MPVCHLSAMHRYDQDQSHSGERLCCARCRIDRAESGFNLYEDMFCPKCGEATQICDIDETEEDETEADEMDEEEDDEDEEDEED